MVNEYELKVAQQRQSHFVQEAQSQHLAEHNEQEQTERQLRSRLLGRRTRRR